MTIIDITGEVNRTRNGDTGVGRSFAPVLSTLASLVQAFSDRRKARRNERVLQSMSDHLLKDIGVTRGDIRARVRGWPY